MAPIAVLRAAVDRKLCRTAAGLNAGWGYRRRSLVVPGA